MFTPIRTAIIVAICLVSLRVSAQDRNYIDTPTPKQLSTGHFIIYAHGGYGMTLRFNNMEDQKRFFRNARIYFPDAQFGYTEQVDAMYGEFKNTPCFIEALQYIYPHC